jgi:hypothetical protein
MQTLIILSEKHCGKCRLKHFPFFTFHSSLFIFHFSFFIFHFSLFTFHFSLFIFHFSLFIFHFSLFIFHFSLFAFHFSLFTFHFSLFAWAAWRGEACEAPSEAKPVRWRPCEAGARPNYYKFSIIQLYKTTYAHLIKLKKRQPNKFFLF